MSDKKQSFENHAMIVPPFHIGLSLILVINLLWAAWSTFRAPSIDHGVSLLLAIGLLGIFWYMRIFPLTVQDRVIRLEMRLRLREVLPEDLRGRIGEIKKGQIIALRFASDAELPELTRQALDEGLSRTEIKKRIRDWQADDLRL